MLIRMNGFDELCEAKRRRDIVRAAILAVLRTTPALPEELFALLRADETATAALAEAVTTHTEGA